MDLPESDREEVYETKINIKIHEIMEYFGGGKRSVQAGGELLEAGFIYAIGIAPPPSVGIIGLVIQTSAMSSMPHQVNLMNIEDKSQHWQCSCTCKAGVGQNCKHIAGCLLYIYRFPYLRPISCTELRQQWGKSGRRSMSEKFSAVAVRDLCCIPKRETKCFHISEAQRPVVMDIIFEGAKTSEAFKVKFLNRTIRPENIPQQIDQFEEYFNMIYNHTGLSKFIPIMANLVTPQQQLIFNTKIAKNSQEALVICQNTLTQASALWLLERKLRITGSIAYNLFTYANNRNPNWPQKIKTIYQSSFKGNEHTRYGQHAEQLAKKAYRTLFLLVDCGLVISKDIPLFAISPDGIAYCNGEWRLVEIKCPVLGKENAISDIITTLSYVITDSNNSIAINPKHKYYGQVQLGLAVTNLLTCDFVISGWKSSIE